MKNKVILGLLTTVSLGLFIPMTSHADVSTPSDATMNTRIELPPQEVTGTYNGELDKESLEPPFIPLQSSEFNPQNIVIDIFNEGPKNLNWAAGVINLTTGKIIVEPVSHLQGAKTLTLSLNDSAKKNDILSVYMVSLSGKGNISVRATLIP